MVSLPEFYSGFVDLKVEVGWFWFCLFVGFVCLLALFVWKFSSNEILQSTIRILWFGGFLTLIK